MNPELITIIAIAITAVIAWDGFCLHDLFRADPATVRYLPRWAWAVICLISCPWGGLIYVIAGRNAFGRDLQAPSAAGQEITPATPRAGRND
jgi:hypothetical protein